jgi:hypothetical protein
LALSSHKIPLTLLFVFSINVKSSCEPVRFDNVFTELHTEVYKKILEGRGFGIEDARPSIELVSEFRKVPKTN